MKHFALVAMLSLASLSACKEDLIGKASKDSALDSVPAQVQVVGTIAGRPFTGGTIFIMPEVGEASLLKTVIYSNRSKVTLVCRQLTPSLPADFYYDHVTIWVKNAVGTYPVSSDDKAQAKALVENYTTEGSLGTLSTFADPAGSVQVKALNGSQLALQFDIQGNPETLKETASLSNFKLSGSFTAPVCLGN